MQRERDLMYLLYVLLTIWNVWLSDNNFRKNGRAISLIVFVRKNGSPDTHLVIITIKKTINPLVTDLLYLI